MPRTISRHIVITAYDGSIEPVEWPGSHGAVKLCAIGREVLPILVKYAYGLTARIAVRFEHDGGHRAVKDCFRYASTAAVSRDIAKSPLRLQSSGRRGSRSSDPDAKRMLQRRQHRCPCHSETRTDSIDRGLDDGGQRRESLSRGRTAVGYPTRLPRAATHGEKRSAAQFPNP
jgi:hypothetical protein